MKIKGVFLAASLTAVLCINGNLLAYSGDGDGSAENPYQIADANDLLELSATPTDYSKCFILTADVDMEGQIFTTAIIAPDTDPITDHFQGIPFTGTFDGASHKIINFTINGGSNFFLGLFGQINSGSVNNLGLENFVVSGANLVGGLVGKNGEGDISNCYSTGTVSGGGYVGGIVGENYGNISNCYSTGAVSGYSDSWYVGGLVGAAVQSSIISHCYSTGDINGFECVGGLAGHNSGGMSLCYSTGSVSGSSEVGGLAGENTAGPWNGVPGTISDCYSTDDVTGSSDSWGVGGLVGVNVAGSVISYCSSAGNISCGSNSESVGGLVGQNVSSNSSISECYSTGQVSSSSDSQCVGGLVGYNNHYGSISNCYSTSIVSSSSDSVCTGGLVGQNVSSSISECYSTGAVSGFSYVGGLAGSNCASGSISNCYSTGDVSSSSGSQYTGGLVGVNVDGNSTIIDCYSTGTVSGTLDVGGLVGYSRDDTISNCHSTSMVNASSGSNGVGGLIGRDYYSSISDCYSTGSVSGSSDSLYVGGLVGQNVSSSISECYSRGSISGFNSIGGLVGGNAISSNISNCYSLGNVIGFSGSQYVGGLAGANVESSTISTCYSTGSVSGTSDVGGLVGVNYGGVSSSFWNTQTSGQMTSAGGTGKTTAEMKTISTFTSAGWDFVDETANGTNDYWKIRIVGVEYPRLSWQKYSGGSGTAVDPYQIADANDLLELAATPTDWDKSFILTANADLTGQTFTQSPIAPDTDNTEWNDFQGTPFTGVFDGKGHTISNLTITASTQDYISLFGCVGYGGQIRNLGVENVNIAGRYYASGLMGWNDSGTLIDCYVTGSVSGTENIGGLVGYNFYGTLISCYVTGSVSGTNCVGGLVGLNDDGTLTSCYATGSVSGNSYVSGLVGYNNGGTLISCYATGSASGTGSVGGLVGYNDDGTLTSCYATGSASGTGSVGGLVGYNDYGSITTCFWDIQTSRLTDGVGNKNPDPNGVMGLETTAMMMLSTFTLAGWDFTDTDGDAADWMMLRPGEDYPRLARQTIYSGDIAGLYGVNLVDYAEIAAHWDQTGCPTGCENADINNDGIVDINDLISLADNWLAGV